MANLGPGFIPEVPAEWATTVPKPDAATAPPESHGKKFEKFTDPYVTAIAAHAAPGTVVWDTEASGLHIRVGKRKATFSYFAQRRRRGKRSFTYRKLGIFGSSEGTIGVKEARRLARVLSGRVAGGQIDPNPKTALTFEAAFADYCAYLLRKVEIANEAAREAHEKAVKNDPDTPPPVQKEATWHKIVVGLGKRHLTPQWGASTLAEISAAPDEVNDWHIDVSKRAGLVTGNKCAKVLRATYRYAAKLRRDLPPELPTSGVKMNPEEPREAGMTDAQHRKWADAWRKIENPTRQAYHLLAILCGGRPGEIARLKVTDADFAEHRFTIQKAKASNNIIIPISPPIEQALQMALKAREGDKSEWLFPARAGGHIRKFDGDGLPLWGNGLRHNYKNIAVTMKPAVEEILTEFLQGHAPKGVSRKYVSKMILAHSDALQEAQARISQRIVTLLRINV
jgi:integrase